MPGPCTVDSVQLLCGSDVYNQGVFLNARILACHTTVAELDSVCDDNYAGNTPDTVMLHDTLSLSWTNGEWQTLGFEHPFGYNGSDNLILEFLWQGDDGGSVYNLGYYTSGNRAVDARPSTAERGVPRNYMPRFRIHYSTAGIAEGRLLRPVNGLRITPTPNPFRSSVSLRAAGRDPFSAAVYSSTGGLVRRIGSANSSAALSWDGRDEDGRRVEAGTYFCRVRSGGRVRTVHLVLRN